MKSIWWKRAAALGLMSCIGIAAQAQYVWLNDKGVKQFSDMPPPPSVPKNRILKSADGAPLQSNAAPAQAAEKEKTPPTLAERNADFQKRRMEQAERDKKAAEEEKLAAAKAKNCEQARSYQQSLQSGDRIARRNDNGERIFISDDQRAQEMREVQKTLADCR